jgi:hypothetical protein
VRSILARIISVSAARKAYREKSGRGNSVEFSTKEKKMIRAYLMVALFFLFMLALEAPSASTQQSEYPMMDKIAQKVIDKYQNSSCEDLKAQKEQPADPQQAATKQKVVGLLKSDPKMREQFLNKVAAPIANKMFECGLIP